jgi:hypothetical protein
MRAPTIVLAVCLLPSCAQLDVFFAATTDEGTVYDCVASDGSTVEVCYLDDAAEELGHYLGRTCGEPERRWPWFTNKLNVGCAYSCPPPGYGCNAANGCYCPAVASQ